jgi:FkbM family methyltransferase
MNRLLFLAVSKVVRQLPNTPKKVRAVVAYRLVNVACQGSAIVTTTDGVRITVNLDDWTHRLYVLGELDEPRIAWLVHMTPPGGLFVDVGANIGLYTCTLAHHLADSGEVVAVEPLRSSVELLRSNLALNGLTNVEVIQAAASSTSGGSLPLFEPPSAGPASSGHVRVVDPGDWIQVGYTPILRLDDLLGNRNVDTVKIDVEGHEMEVLEGLASVLERCRPTLLCEALLPQVIEGLHILCDRLGYVAFQDDGSGGLIPADDTPGDILLVSNERTEDLRPFVRG